MTDELDTNIIWGGGGQPQKTYSFSEIAKWVFLTLFSLGFLGLNLKNDIIILILYLKSKDSATHIIMFHSKHR